ncbi:iron ABC transporter permease [Actinotalea sp. Marseille-Q4924]|uniref:iron ABC transporter permease n=1 Tax=Actinotalea sp. Marseille-Q4924 TaxID=2866571 RepID=UPI001CE4001B|nr:iron ABC transporter permease [Actinotalea sp. Marseille-Q4924]
MTTTTPAAVVGPPGDVPRPPTTARARTARGVAFALVGVVVVVLAAVDLTLGTADVDALDLLGLLAGRDDEALAVLVASRLPRVLAALLVGTALGAAGAVLQSVARNPLASPDTLAVNAGGYLLVVVAAVIGVSLPLPVRGLLAFVGGLAAAALVLAVARAGATGPTRLVLAGSAVSIALASVTMVLLLVYSQETTGLFAWGSGSVAQSGLRTVTQVAPVVVLGVVALVALGRRLDVLALGDDAARSLGLDVRRTRVGVVVLAVVLAAAAVTVAGPIGFVGLAAPVLARMLARRVPGLSAHGAVVPLAALVGCVVVLAADVALRLLVPASSGTVIPTGVATTLVGAVVLVVVASRLRDDVARSRTANAGARPATRRLVATTAAVVVALLAGAVVAALLLGDRLLLLGDVGLWARGRSGGLVTFVLDQRVPRVLAALVAGAALGLAGTLVQAVARNPLAEPGLLGITGGAGVGAVLLIGVAPAAGVWEISAAAAVGAVIAFVVVWALARRGGLGSDRVVLVGVGVSAAAAAITTVVVVVTNPYSTTAALTWLSGSTYGRSLEQSVPAAVALAVALPASLAAARTLDLLALDDDTPRVLGVPLGGARLRLLVLAGALTASAVSAVGVVGFVGLVAPHLARRLVGSAHRRSLPVATLLGAVLVSVADTIGRTVVAPGQLPVGLITALVGTPYFVHLLWRTRRA